VFDQPIPAEELRFDPPADYNRKEGATMSIQSR
jgi:hypothetical protein